MQINNTQTWQYNEGKDERDNLIRRMRAEGMTYQQVADEVGASVATAHYVARDVELHPGKKLLGADGKYYPVRHKKRNADRAIFVADEVADAYNALCIDGIVPVVYLITDGELCKIGYTSQLLHERVTELQVGNGRKLRVLGVWQGTMDDEAALHATFARLRREGEWFDLDVPDVILIQHTLENHRSLPSQTVLF